jgi:hypothetical protein
MIVSIFVVYIQHESYSKPTSMLFLLNTAVFVLIFVTYLPESKIQKKFSIYSNKFFYYFHLSESSFTCSRLRASGLAWNWYCVQSRETTNTNFIVSAFITVFTVFRLLTDFVCLYNYEFWLSLCKIVRLKCCKMLVWALLGLNKGNNKITELRTILQRESQNS